jgi:hypothetical protein
MSESFGQNVFEKVTIPDAVNGTNSRAFSAPRGAKTMTLHIPSLTSGATVKIQAADPRGGDQDALTWRDISAAVITATIGFCALTTIPGNAATTIPVAALGAGALRLVASAAQTGAVDNETILITWGFDGGTFAY